MACKTQKQWPLSDDESDVQKEQFINSISSELVKSLIEFHTQSSCYEFDKRKNGSYNVCFFYASRSDETKWVVRIPIITNVHDVWQKVQSEVATLRYLKQRTRIPVPDVLAYGQTKDSRRLPYVIIQYCGNGPGSGPLDLLSFVKASDQQRRHLYSQLIDILAELRRHEFPQGGCLLTSDTSPDTFYMGAPLSPLLNDIQCEYGFRTPQPFDKTSDFVEHRFSLLNQLSEKPYADRAMDSVRTEIVAVNGIRECLPSVIETGNNQNSFVLSHPDLGCRNIIVDDEYTILGIIDWEFTSTVPHRFFLPPYWLGGNIGSWVSTPRYQLEYKVFYDVLLSKSSDEWCRRLADEWGEDVSKQDGVHVALALSGEATAACAYFLGIRQTLRQERLQFVDEFFERDATNGGHYRQIAQDRYQDCLEYTKYLDAKESTIQTTPSANHPAAPALSEDSPKTIVPPQVSEYGSPALQSLPLNPFPVVLPVHRIPEC